MNKQSKLSLVARMNLKLLFVLSLGSAAAFHSTVVKYKSPLSIRQDHQRFRPLAYATLTSAREEPETKRDEDNIGVWVPIHAVSHLRGLGPQQITVMGLDVVVWESLDKTWSVMTDACPHRLAPLSQGRVDPETGCIECPYHGWQFDSEGTLKKLPQLDEGKDISKITAKATYFPTHVAGDLILAFIPTSVHGEIFLQSTLPEEMFPTLKEDMAQNKTYYVRDLPYSQDVLIENFMDPSHIPFAHNALQSVRSDGTPIPMTALVSNFTHVELTFKDQSRGKVRDGVVSFQRPTMYHFRTRREEDGDYKTDLNIHVIPVKAGRSRVIFATVAFDHIPVWFQHAASNRFLNTDSWLHDSEFVMRQRSEQNQSYFFATASDGGVQGFRRWWSKYGASKSPPNTFGPAAKEALTRLNRRQQIDPWEYHARHCVSCRNSLRMMKRLEFGGLATAVFSSMLLRQKPIVAALLAAAGLYVRHMSQRSQTLIEGNPSPAGTKDRSPAHQEDYQVERRWFVRKLSKRVKEQDSPVK